MRQLFKAIEVYKRSLFDQELMISCLLCRGDTSFKEPMCSLCMEKCLTPEITCHYCALPLSLGIPNICANCLRKKPVYDQSCTGFLYRFPVDHLIQGIKYHHQLYFLKPLTRILAQRLREAYQASQWPEAVIPIPLHKKRLRSRGYDQTLLIARALTRQLCPVKMPVEVRLLQRIVATRPQQELSFNERQKNMRKAFFVKKNVKYQHVAIIDDVVTTGATITEAVKTLKRRGVKRVDIWSLARTP